jgi:hypothetical protein
MDTIINAMTRATRFGAVMSFHGPASGAVHLK